jgi:DMSO/TMAO reductase YedYZ molybdopterin-dependent catalytic subunit
MTQQDRIVKARLKLMNRFKEAQRLSPSIGDDQPQGTGSTNRHGMPVLPVGQVRTEKWPVLDLGIRPDWTVQNWSLQLDGAVDNPVTLSWDAFQELDQIEDVSDFHCVTTWSRMDLRWQGVRFSTLAALVSPSEQAQHLMCYGADGYTTNISLLEALKDDVLLVHTVEGHPLEPDHGGPVRMITPQLYAWKGAKWINRIEFLETDRKGYWEERGYSNTAYPWRNDRYS